MLVLSTDCRCELMQFMCTFCFELLWNSISLCSLTTLFVCILFSGEFTGGGNIAVECSPFLVAEVETRGRFGKVDGRFPHWVTPYDGTRYSLIYVRHYFWFAVMTCFVSLTLIISCYNSDLNHISKQYVTSGTVEPQSTAIFAPPQPSEDAKSQAWVPPPVFIH